MPCGGGFDVRPWLKLTPGLDWRLGVAPKLQHFSPYTALHEHASRKPDADAIVTEDATVTYGEFAERVVVSASWLLH